VEWGKQTVIQAGWMEIFIISPGKGPILLIVLVLRLIIGTSKVCVNKQFCIHHPDENL